MTRLRALCLCAAVLAIALVGGAGRAAAHAGMGGVNPADGAVLDAAPPLVEIRFTENVGLHREGVRVLDDRGRRLDVGSDEVITDGLVIQPLPAVLVDGWYVVTWAVISEDGHVVRGASTFGVGKADAAARARAAELASSVADGVPWLQRIVRQAADIAVVIAVGAMAVLVFTSGRRPKRLAEYAATVAAVFSAGWALLDVLNVGGLDTWFERAGGAAVAVRVGVLIACACLVRRLPRASALLGACSLATYGFVGHARSLGLWWLDGGLVVVHLIAAAIWLGAAPAMLLHLADRSVADDRAGAAARTFSRTATVALPLVLVPGVVLAWRATRGSWTWGYTGALAIKVAVTLVAVLIGFATRRRLRGGISRRHLITTFAVDSAAVAVVVALAASIASTPPPVHRVVHGGAGTQAPSVESACTANVGPLRVRVVINPGRVGSNEVWLSAAWNGAEIPGAMLLRLAHEGVGSARLEIPLERRPPTRWYGTGTFPLGGEWTVEIAYRPDEFTVERAECVITVS